MAANHVTCGMCGYTDEDGEEVLGLPIEPGPHGAILTLMAHRYEVHPAQARPPRDWGAHHQRVQAANVVAWGRHYADQFEEGA